MNNPDLIAEAVDAAERIYGGFVFQRPSRYAEQMQAASSAAQALAHYAGEGWFQRADGVDPRIGWAIRSALHRAGLDEERVLGALRQLPEALAKSLEMNRSAGTNAGTNIEDRDRELAILLAVLWRVRLGEEPEFTRNARFVGFVLAILDAFGRPHGRREKLFREVEEYTRTLRR